MLKTAVNKSMVDGQMTYVGHVEVYHDFKLMYKISTDINRLTKEDAEADANILLEEYGDTVKGN